jgi:hypothetical protein
MVANAKSFETYQLCALVSKANGEEPIGSAVSFDHCLVMELPLPWPRDALQADHVPQGVLAVLKQTEERGLIKVRPQAIIPDPEYSQPGYTRVIHYHRPNERIVHYEKNEFVVPDVKVEPLVEALFKKPERLPRFATYRQETRHIREMLVCTHGSRDTCCGTFGAPIYQALREKYVSASTGQLRVWRTSHTGGHRFAPTLIDFPDGRYWGRVELAILDLLVKRNGPVTRLHDFYRGWSALTTPEQVAEREIWMREGWPWLEYQKTSRVLTFDEANKRTKMRIEFGMPEEAIFGAYEATVEVYGSVMTLPSSGAGPLQAEALYRVSNLTKFS